MIKRILKAVLAKAGYSVTRTPAPLPPRRIRGLIVGGIPIRTDSTALINSYEQYPETNAFLGRLSAFLFSQNPALAAIDIGANCGDSAAIMRVSTPLMPILCIEGDPQMVDVLTANVAHWKDTFIHAAYLGECENHITARIDKEGWNATLTKADDRHSRQIHLYRLDDIALPWANGLRVGLIKLDTEGYDVAILHGSKALLQSNRPVLVVEYNREAMTQTGEEGLRLFSYLRSVGYGNFLAYDAFGRFLLAGDIHDTEFVGDLHDYADGIHGKVYYYDFVFFPAEHADNARQFIKTEREHRLAPRASLVQSDFY